MKRIFFLFPLVFLLFLCSCDSDGGLPFVFVDPDVTMYTWTEPDRLVVAVAIDANPTSGFANETLNHPSYFWYYTVECYNITTDDPVGDSNGASPVEYANSIVVSWADEFYFPYGVDDITATDSLAIVVKGSVGVSFETDVIHSQYNFEEVLFLTAP